MRVTVQRKCVFAIPWLLAGLCRAQVEPPKEPPKDPPMPVFGTTVVIPSGLRGEIYHINEFSEKLPNFEKMKSRGSIYTTSLNIPNRQFEEGFPGVTKRYEYFAIDYKGRFWIEKPGEYTFSLTSDDGSKLYIDGQEIVDNDGIHAVTEKSGKVTLAGGIHQMRVSYFQGPGTYLALVLQVAGPGEAMRVFTTDEFKPPPNPDDWKFGAGRGGGH